MAICKIAGAQLGFSDICSRGCFEFSESSDFSTSLNAGNLKQGLRGNQLCVHKQKHRIMITAAAGPVKRPRRLILLRHAHSSWSNPALKDHDRSLSRRGRQQASSIGGKLGEIGWIPELILCSDSTRTQETLRIMQRHCVGLLKAEVHLLPSYYSTAAMDGHTAQHLQQTVCKYSRDDMSTILCMGHNRGWEEAAGVFCGKSVELKTANAALLEASGTSWQEAFALAGTGGWKLRQILQPAESAESSGLDIDFLA